MKSFNIKPAARAVAETLHRSLFSYMTRMGLIKCAAHTAASAFTDGSGTTYAISATLPATYDAAGYGATATTYTAIGKVETFTPYGSSREVRKFMPLSGATEKSKSQPDYGGGDMVVADVPADAGQVIVKAAEAAAAHYSMKITFPDGEVHYLDVIVTSWVLSGATTTDFQKRTAHIEICRAPVIVAAP